MVESPVGFYGGGRLSIFPAHSIIILFSIHQMITNAPLFVCLTFYKWFKGFAYFAVADLVYNRYLRTVMMKILVGVFMGTFLWFTANFLSMYLPYLAEDIQTNEIVFGRHPMLLPKNATRRLEYLNGLVEMPLIGRFFIEEKIK